MRLYPEAEQSRKFIYSILLETAKCLRTRLAKLKTQDSEDTFFFYRTKVTVNHLPLTCSFQGRALFIFLSKCLSNLFSSLYIQCYYHTPCHNYHMPEWLQLPPNWPPHCHLFSTQSVFHITVKEINRPITSHCF